MHQRFGLSPTRRARRIAAPLLAVLLTAGLGGGAPPAMARDTAPPPDLTAIAVSPPPGARVPADAVLRDAAGRAVPLAAMLGGPPVVLAMVYYTCPNLCGVTLDGIAGALRETGFQAGGGYRLAVVSIDPAEGPAEAAAARARALDRLGRTGAAGGVRFLTGDAAAVRWVADSVGFRYRWDAALKQFLHPVGVYVLTPDGRVSRWISGAGFDGGDLRLALTEAGGGRIGTLGDQLLLLCYHYDPARGVYTSVVQEALRVTGGLMVLAVGGGIGWALRRERHRRRHGTTEGDGARDGPSAG